MVQSIKIESRTDLYFGEGNGAWALVGFVLLLVPASLVLRYFRGSMSLVFPAIASLYTRRAEKDEKSNGSSNMNSYSFEEGEEEGNQSKTKAKTPLTRWERCFIAILGSNIKWVATLSRLCHSLIWILLFAPILFLVSLSSSIPELSARFGLIALGISAYATFMLYEIRFIDARHTKVIALISALGIVLYGIDFVALIKPFTTIGTYSIFTSFSIIPLLLAAYSYRVNESPLSPEFSDMILSSGMLDFLPETSLLRNSNSTGVTFKKFTMGFYYVASNLILLVGAFVVFIWSDETPGFGLVLFVAANVSELSLLLHLYQFSAAQEIIGVLLLLIVSRYVLICFGTRHWFLGNCMLFIFYITYMCYEVLRDRYKGRSGRDKFAATAKHFKSMKSALKEDFGKKQGELLLTPSTKGSSMKASIGPCLQKILKSPFVTHKETPPVILTVFFSIETLIVALKPDILLVPDILNRPQYLYGIASILIGLSFVLLEYSYILTLYGNTKKWKFTYVYGVRIVLVMFIPAIMTLVGLSFLLTYLSRSWFILATIVFGLLMVTSFAAGYQLWRQCDFSFPIDFVLPARGDFMTSNPLLPAENQKGPEIKEETKGFLRILRPVTDCLKQFARLFQPVISLIQPLFQSAISWIHPIIRIWLLTALFALCYGLVLYVSLDTSFKLYGLVLGTICPLLLFEYCIFYTNWYETFSFNRVMKVILLLGILEIIGGTIFLFSKQFNFSLNYESAKLCLFILAVINVQLCHFTYMLWREDNWHIKPIVLGLMLFNFVLFLVAASALMYKSETRFIGAMIIMYDFAIAAIITAFRQLVRANFKLTKPLRKAMISIWVFLMLTGCIGMWLSGYDRYILGSTGWFLISVLVLGVGIYQDFITTSRWNRVFSVTIFPIYELDPRTNKIGNKNVGPAAIILFFTMHLTWGLCSSLVLTPPYIGMISACLSLVFGLYYILYRITTSTSSFIEYSEFISHEELKIILLESVGIIRTDAIIEAVDMNNTSGGNKKIDEEKIRLAKEAANDFKNNVVKLGTKIQDDIKLYCSKRFSALPLIGLFYSITQKDEDIEHYNNLAAVWEETIEYEELQRKWNYFSFSFATKLVTKAKHAFESHRHGLIALLASRLKLSNEDLDNLLDSLSPGRHKELMDMYDDYLKREKLIREEKDNKRKEEIEASRLRAQEEKIRAQEERKRKEEEEKDRVKTAEEEARIARQREAQEMQRLLELERQKLKAEDERRKKEEGDRAKQRQEVERLEKLKIEEQKKKFEEEERNRKLKAEEEDRIFMLQIEKMKQEEERIHKEADEKKRKEAVELRMKQEQEQKKRREEMEKQRQQEQQNREKIEQERIRQQQLEIQKKRDEEKKRKEDEAELKREQENKVKKLQEELAQREKEERERAQMEKKETAEKNAIDIEVLRAQAKGGKFTDTTFSFPGDKARLTEVLDEKSMKENIGKLGLPLQSSATPDDIQQGELGDCWYLSAISCISSNQKLLQRVFIRADIEMGIYIVKFYKNGKWKDVFIDDYIPVKRFGKRSVPMYAKTKSPNQVWVNVLEKAYAKLHGSYKAIEGGLVHIGLTDLTGGFGDIMDIKPPANPDVIWCKLIELYRDGHLLGAGSPAGSDTDISEYGIVQGHAYSILDVQEVDAYKLLKLRNPWGQTEWKGAWSDKSKEWTSRTKSKVNYKDADDGSFWMCFQDFILNYDEIYSCRLFDKEITGKGFNSEVIEGAWDNTWFGGCNNTAQVAKNPQYILEVREAANFYISLSQGEDRGEAFASEQCAIGTYVVKGPNPIKNRIGASAMVLSPKSFSYTRDALVEGFLNPGTYVIIPCAFNPTDRNTFTLGIFSNSSFSLKKTPIN